MRIPLINPYSYFLDYVQLNWKFPIENQSNYDREIIKNTYRDTFFILKEFIQSKQIESYYTEYLGIMVLKDNHYNIKVHFKGSFFSNQKTKDLKNDIKEVLLKFQIFHEIIESELRKKCGDKIAKELHHTVTRIDIAKNFISEDLKGFPILDRRVKEDKFYRSKCDKLKGKDKELQYITGYSSGSKKGDSGVHFKCYDKRFELNGVDSCVQRFGSYHLIRKEWRIKSRKLRRELITDIYDLSNFIINKKVITYFIYKIRKIQDYILDSDDETYKSIHDDIKLSKLETYNPKEVTVSGHDYLKAIEKKYKIYLNKKNPKTIKSIFWNPFKQVNSLIEKKGKYLSKPEMIELINKLYTEYATNKIETDNYESEIEKTIQLIKKDSQIQKSLRILDLEKRKINLYTKKVISNQKYKDFEPKI